MALSPRSVECVGGAEKQKRDPIARAHRKNSFSLPRSPPASLLPPSRAMDTGILALLGLLVALLAGAGAALVYLSRASGADAEGAAAPRRRDAEQEPVMVSCV